MGAILIKLFLEYIYFVGSVPLENLNLYIILYKGPENS